MSRVAITADVWTDRRFVRLQQIMGWGRASTLGFLTLLWHQSRLLTTSSLSLEEMLVCIPPIGNAQRHALKTLIDCRYVKSHADRYVVVDNDAYHSKAAKLRANGSKGGLARSEAFKQRKAGTRTVCA